MGKFTTIFIGHFFITTFGFGATLGIKTEHSGYLPFDPINLEIKYSGTENVVLIPEAGNVQIHIIKNGKAELYQPFSQVDMQITTPKPVIPVDLTYVKDISTDGKKWVFAESGSYQVYATLSQLVSNTIDIQILSVSGDDVLDMKKISECSTCPLFQYFGGGDFLPDALNLHKQIGAGNSAFAQQSNILLVSNYSQFSSDLKGNRRAIDRQKVKQYYQIASRKWRKQGDYNYLHMLSRVARGMTKKEVAQEMGDEYIRDVRNTKEKVEINMNSDIQSTIDEIIAP